MAERHTPVGGWRSCCGARALVRRVSTQKEGRGGTKGLGEGVGGKRGKGKEGEGGEAGDGEGKRRGGGRKKPMGGGRDSVCVSEGDGSSGQSLRHASADSRIVVGKWLGLNPGHVTWSRLLSASPPGRRWLALRGSSGTRTEGLAVPRTNFKEGTSAGVFVVPLTWRRFATPELCAGHLKGSSFPSHVDH